jgi:hypothetical protein
MSEYVTWICSDCLPGPEYPCRLQIDSETDEIGIWYSPTNCPFNKAQAKWVRVPGANFKGGLADEVTECDNVTIGDSIPGKFSDSKPVYVESDCVIVDSTECDTYYPVDIEPVFSGEKVVNNVPFDRLKED